MQVKRWSEEMCWVLVVPSVPKASAGHAWARASLLPQESCSVCTVARSIGG